jgi:hypothetical protein
MSEAQILLSFCVCVVVVRLGLEELWMMWQEDRNEPSPMRLWAASTNSTKGGTLVLAP